MISLSMFWITSILKLNHWVLYGTVAVLGSNICLRTLLSVTEKS